MKISFNYLAIIVASLAGLLVSFVWFVKIFAAPYLEGLGKTKAEMDAGATGMEATAMQLAGNIVMAFVLAWLIKSLGYQTALDGIKLSAIAWLAFVVSVIGPLYAYQAFSLQFFCIVAGGILACMLVIGGILGAWK